MYVRNKNLELRTKAVDYLIMEKLADVNAWLPTNRVESGMLL